MFFVSCAAVLCHVSLAKLLLDSVVGVGSGAAVVFRAVVVIGCCCGAAPCLGHCTCYLLLAKFYSYFFIVDLC